MLEFPPPSAEPPVDPLAKRFSIRVRSLRAEERKTAVGVIHQSIRAINVKDYSPQQIEKIVDMYGLWSFSGKAVVVAEHRSQMVGIAIAQFSLFSAPWIQAVFTHPEFVRKGVGRVLVTELERRAVLRNSKTLLVMSSLTAVGFYEALHYQRLTDTTTVGNIPCVFMEKPLQPVTLIDRLVGIGLLFLGLMTIFLVLYGLIAFCIRFFMYGV